jgi:1-acyl-sn-glycerol-3-phosphate acyltransferase
MPRHLGFGDFSFGRQFWLMLANLAAHAFLVAIVAIPLASAVIGWRRTEMSPLQFGMWILARALTRLLWRATASGPLQLPSGQGAVLVCNHRSSVDPFFIQTLTTRKTHWMVAREFCEHPAFRWFLRTCEVIPVNRGGIDTAATRHAIRLASDGQVVGMLPEGRINMTDRLLLAGRPGAALVALKANVPIVPCYIEGAPYDEVPWSPFFMPARVRVHFGQPLDVSAFHSDEADENGSREVLLQAMRAIAALAGDLEFEPQVAGKGWKPTAEQLASDKEGNRRRRRENSGKRRV